MFGRLRGGAAYVSTLGSAMIGLIAGNSGLGVALPPNSTMFIILALPAAAGASASSVYVALACGGAYAVLYRLAVVWWWTRRDNIAATPRDDLKPFAQAMREGWRSPSIFLGIIIPVLLTIGPVGGYLAKESAIGAPAAAVGLDPTVAIIAILLCTSTEGASPPVGAPKVRLKEPSWREMPSENELLLTPV